MTTQVLTIFLIKDAVPPPDKILDESRSPTATQIPVGAITGTLYTISSDLDVPRWASFLASAVDPKALGLHTASASAVLVVPMSNRTFALSFGYGRYMIDPMVVESTFGLRVTLNSLPIDSIRSIDKRTFEGISTHTQEQASKETSIGDFGLNVERDVVRAVTGTPSDASLGGQLTGKDSLTDRCTATLDSLPEFLQAYYAKSQETEYKKNYPWIDNIVEIRDPAKVNHLDDRLADALRMGANPKIWSRFRRS